ncbi:MAG: hypothetical protein ACK44W_00755 [Planctomycetota bacterium]
MAGPDPSERSFLEDLLYRTGAFVRNQVSDLVRRPIEDAARKILSRLVRTLVAATLLGAGAILLLTAALEGMKAAGVPSWAASLGAGAAAILVGLALLVSSHSGPPA